MQVFLDLREAIVVRAAEEADEHVATAAEREAVRNALATTARLLHDMHTPLQAASPDSPLLARYAMLSDMADRLGSWLLAGPAGQCGLLADAGLAAVAAGLPAEVLAPHRALLRSQ